jgi:hypothetical protein
LASIKYTIICHYFSPIIYGETLITYTRNYIACSIDSKVKERSDKQQQEIEKQKKRKDKQIAKSKKEKE